nr:retrovirus-related Pol polyprotein from transposon TNT 1-94 [Tanacetum cinerariifolium]
TKSWLWHRRLSHLNFGAINHLARQGLLRGLPKLKFEKDHLCSACAMGKSTKKSHKPKSEDTCRKRCGEMFQSDVSEQTMGLSLLIKHCGIIMKMLASLMRHLLHALHSKMGSLKDVTGL